MKALFTIGVEGTPEHIDAARDRIDAARDRIELAADALHVTITDRPRLEPIEEDT